MARGGGTVPAMIVHSVAQASPVMTHSPHWWATLTAWGNIGSFIGGVSAALLAVAAIIGGSAGLSDWREKQREQRDLAREEAENIRLDRQRVLNGWTPTGLEVYGVQLVTSPDELAQARDELGGGGPTAYVVLRVNESSSGNENRAYNLRQMITRRGYVTRPPERGEYQALELGRQTLLSRPGGQ
jgi:hypothetical protein